MSQNRTLSRVRKRLEKTVRHTASELRLILRCNEVSSPCTLPRNQKRTMRQDPEDEHDQRRPEHGVPDGRGRRVADHAQQALSGQHGGRGADRVVGVVAAAAGLDVLDIGQVVVQQPNGPALRVHMGQPYAVGAPGSSRTWSWVK